MKRKDLELKRDVNQVDADCDLCVVGGGLAGTCCAITAAREGAQVVLIQDRPVLGGNSSSEVRLWALGASAHNHNNNRWAREGGVIDEILVENMNRNPEGNPLIYDTILLEKVTEIENITLLLNTAADRIETEHDETSGTVCITSVSAYSASSETRYTIFPKHVVDSSGDGIVAYLAGLPFRIGAETYNEFKEGFVPDPEDYGELLGHSLFFMTKDTGKPVQFVPPSYALKDVEHSIPRFKNFGVHDQGCEFWWIEYGGRLDTIHDNEQIKWELWKIVLGVWNYIKNSGNYPEAETMTLEWVGHIPGKRESRRFEGVYMLRQQDLVEQKVFDDAVSYGGWSIDLHPADGVYTAKPGCDQYHTKGVYQIPYASIVHPHAANLFLSGRIISASHVAFGSIRVMCTCAHTAQAAAVAAVMCTEQGLSPVDLIYTSQIPHLQQRLVRRGQFIPGYRLQESENLILSGSVTSSSSLNLAEDLHPDTALDAWRSRSVEPPERTAQFDQRMQEAEGGKTHRESLQSYGEYQKHDNPDDSPELFSSTPIRQSLRADYAQMIPVEPGTVPRLEFFADVLKETRLHVELRAAEKAQNYTPETLIDELWVDLEKGRQPVVIASHQKIFSSCYVYVIFRKNPFVSLRTRPERVTGMFTLERKGYQEPPLKWGIDGFELWTPPRRPEGWLFAFSAFPAPAVYGPETVKNGYQRPYILPNAWCASVEDKQPWLSVAWQEKQQIRRLEIVFDTDYNHPMETVIRGHPENRMPMCVSHFRIMDGDGQVIHECSNWYQSVWVHEFEHPVQTDKLTVEILEMNGDAPAAVFEIRAYG